ncbi:MAG: molybdate ABC transporter substrate-binding protein [Methanoregulaceae archaeon]
MNSKSLTVILVLLVAGIVLAAGCTSSSSTVSPQATVTAAATAAPSVSQGTLIVYGGAGLKAPLDELGQMFYDKYGVTVQYVYGGAGTLVSQMNLTKKGDVFMPGSTVEFGNAKSQGLVNSSKLVAYHVPVIVVQKGNPKNITTLQDFTKSGVKVALGDVNATAIGKASAKMFQKLNISSAVEKNVVTRTPTINELVIVMNTGQADAAVMTLDSVNATTMDSITIPLSTNVILITPIGATTFTTQPDLASKFVDFVASDEGKAVFKKHGFPTYPDAAYANVTA